MNIYDDYAKKDIDIKNLRIRIKDLEKENRLLKDKINAFESSKFNTMALLEIQHPKTAREAENLLQVKKVFERLYNDRLYCLEEENNNLKNELMEDMKYETKLEQENKNLKLTLEQMENTCKDYLNDRDTLREENKKLKERIDILYEFIERNDKLVDKVIDEEDLDKLNRYIYIDDDLVDRALESKD